MSDELEQERELLTRLERAKHRGELDDAEYEATKADILTRIAELETEPPAGASAGTSPDPKADRKFTLGCLGVFILLPLMVFMLSMCSSSGGSDPGSPGGGSGGGGAGGQLRESEAEVACERVVRERLGGSASFKQGANWEIAGGWAVHGMVSSQGREVGYSCDVTGPSGQHTVTVTQLDW